MSCFHLSLPWGHRESRKGLRPGKTLSYPQLEQLDSGARSKLVAMLLVVHRLAKWSKGDSIFSIGRQHMPVLADCGESKKPKLLSRGQVPQGEEPGKVSAGNCAGIAREHPGFLTESWLGCLCAGQTQPDTASSPLNEHPMLFLCSLQSLA